MGWDGMKVPGMGCRVKVGGEATVLWWSQRSALKVFPTPTRRYCAVRARKWNRRKAPGFWGAVMGCSFQGYGFPHDKPDNNRPYLM